MKIIGHWLLAEEHSEVVPVDAVNLDLVWTFGVFEMDPPEGGVSVVARSGDSLVYVANRPTREEANTLLVNLLWAINAVRLGERTSVELV